MNGVAKTNPPTASENELRHFDLPARGLVTVLTELNTRQKIYVPLPNQKQQCKKRPTIKQLAIKRYTVSLTRQLSRHVPADACLLCVKAAVFGNKIKRTLQITIYCGTPA